MGEAGFGSMIATVRLHYPEGPPIDFFVSEKEARTLRLGGPFWIEHPLPGGQIHLNSFRIILCSQTTAAARWVGESVRDNAASGK